MSNPASPDPNVISQHGTYANKLRLDELEKHVAFIAEQQALTTSFLRHAFPEQVEAWKNDESSTPNESSETG